jgi:peroxiredoxin
VAALPDFSLPDLDGRTWDRAALLGRPAVVFCFSTW